MSDLVRRARLNYRFAPYASANSEYIPDLCDEIERLEGELADEKMTSQRHADGEKVAYEYAMRVEARNKRLTKALEGLMCNAHRIDPQGMHVCTKASCYVAREALKEEIVA